MKVYIIASLILVMSFLTTNGQVVQNNHKISIAVIYKNSAVKFMLGNDFNEYKLTSNETDFIEKLISRVSDSLNLTTIQTYTDKKINDTLRHVFQIIPGKNGNGDVICYVNAVCEPKENWRQDLSIVDDGGSCYYSFKIKLPELIYFDIQINATG